MVAKKVGGKVKTLPTKALSRKKEKAVKGGSFNGYVNFGDIKGESTDKDHKDWLSVMQYGKTT